MNGPRWGEGAALDWPLTPLRRASTRPSGRRAMRCLAPMRRRARERPGAEGARSPVRGLGLVELVLDLGHVLWRHTPLGEIDVALLLVHTQDERDLLPADVDLRRAQSAPLAADRRENRFKIPTNFFTERMRRRESSESKIMPSVSSYSRSDTYTPITSMRLTKTTTLCSRSGYFSRYIRLRRLGSLVTGTKGILSPGTTNRLSTISVSSSFLSFAKASASYPSVVGM